jgi:hypothetical protein
MSSQIPRDKWHDYLGDATMADAILDLIIHNAHKVVLNGPSRRKGKGESHRKPTRTTSVASLRS